MKFAYGMLADFVQTDLDAQGVGDLLTMAGFELEGVEGDVLDIKVTSNRGDGLSVLGLAREVLAKDPASRPTEAYARATGGFADVSFGGGEPPSVTVESENCRRFSAVRIDGVRPGEASPVIRERLEKAGMRSIGLIVDLTNYVMLELGAPTHAFDLDKLAGGRIVVREARDGESVKTLDGGDHTAIGGLTMVCDGERPVSIAGIMGGAESEVTETTTSVLLEAGNWRPIPIRKTRKALGLGTEANYRFERDVDPLSTLPALRRFVDLLRAELPDVSVSGLADVAQSPRPVPPITLRMSRATRLLGMEVSAEEARGYLSRLGMDVSGDGEQFSVTPPTWRPDLRREDDLVEEIGRIHGYEKIPERLPQGRSASGGLHGSYLRDARLRDAAVRLGFVQTISHSLRDFSPLDATGPDTRVGPRQVASPEASVLRDSLLPGLAEAASRNGGRDVAFFESGRVFPASGEVASFALLQIGRLLPEHRQNEAVPGADFLSLKGVVEEILEAFGSDLAVEIAEKSDPRFHPYRQARIVPGGVMGQLHPEVAKKLGLPEQTFAAEFVPATLSVGDLEIRAISRNPAVRRDLAILAPDSLAYSAIESTIRTAAGADLERVWVFDVYTGPGVPEGSRSIGVGVSLRKPGANFTDEEANRVRDSIVAGLAGVGASIR